MALTKGFEVEIYTGTPEGVAVGFADQVVAALPNFVTEPDRRNVEYTTSPLRRYADLPCALLKPRQALRQFLPQPYTLLPGSTLALGGEDHFERSDPDNPYHTYIENTYGTTVVTASIHINIGLTDMELLFQACRLIRAEASLYLALSAASPFRNGHVTGSHSSRWQLFPPTPKQVPFFASHQHYIDWTEAQIAAGIMFNPRHLWAAVRPNGDNRPHDLNRIELRICDMVSDPLALLAITALLEARLLQMSLNPEQFEPFRGAFTPTELETIATENEQAAARHSLDAQLIHWQTGQTITAAAWIEQQYTDAWLIAHQYGFAEYLAPIQQILREGNEAQRWLRAHQGGQSVTDVYQVAIASMADQEQRLLREICAMAPV